MDTIGDILVEAWERAHKKLAQISKVIGPGLTALGALFIILCVWYTVWAFTDQIEACDTAAECNRMTHRDKVVRNAIGLACSVRQDDCDALPLLRGPARLLSDIYMPLCALGYNLVYYILWNYGIAALALLPVGVVALLMLVAADKVAALVAPAFRIIQRGLHVPVNKQLRA